MAPIAEVEIQNWSNFANHYDSPRRIFLKWKGPSDDPITFDKDNPTCHGSGPHKVKPGTLGHLIKGCETLQRSFIMCESCYHKLPSEQDLATRINKGFIKIVRHINGTPIPK
jgi:hypothetical protein